MLKKIDFGNSFKITRLAPFFPATLEYSNAENFADTLLVQQLISEKIGFSYSFQIVYELVPSATVFYTNSLYFIRLSMGCKMVSTPNQAKHHRKELFEKRNQNRLKINRELALTQLAALDHNSGSFVFTLTLVGGAA